MRVSLPLAGLLAASPAALALEPREGWFIAESPKPYAELLADLKEAVVAEKMGLVTEAGPTEAAAARGVTIPGNRVVGVFRPDFAIRALQASEAAMIEAPIRFYVTERAGGGSAMGCPHPRGNARTGTFGVCC
jgi:uncharacterized protein (DUF302 family)